MLKVVITGILFFGLMVSARAMAEESPDELYSQGRFAEAEKSYALLDMDHPKDIRYRYNKGAAAYQNSDFKRALAAFSSVLRRTKDKAILFKTSYNLGNVAYKQGDFESAQAFYEQAIVYSTSNRSALEDARHNLELALRVLEKKKQEKEESPHQPPKDDDQGKEKKPPSDSDKQQEDSQKSSDEKRPDESKSREQDQKADRRNSESGQRKKPEKKSPKDLSGDLKPLQDPPAKKEGGQTPEQAMSSMDRKKAQALLDNIKEDRSRFLRFQIPEDKKYGVASGKDW